MNAELATWSADAALVSELLAVNPSGLGGVLLRAGAGPERDLVCAWIRRLSMPGAPFLRLPLHVSEDRLLGGLSLAATLGAGYVVTERGLLAQADGGIVVVAMAERLGATVCAQVSAALDHGELPLERDGIAARFPCRIGVIALDEGIDDERAPAALRDRLAFSLELSPTGRSLTDAGPDGTRVSQARALLPAVEIGDDMVDALCQAAVALGVESMRSAVLAAAVARAHAALCARTVVDATDAAVAARLVLGPRATQMPVESPAEEELAADDEIEDAAESEPQPQQPPAEDADASPTPEDLDAKNDGGALDELVVQAARSGIPAGILEALTFGRETRATPRRGGRSGAVRASRQGGRPTGTRAAMPREGEKLNVVETLRAAAPWQRLRRAERGTDRVRVQVRKQDFRVTRFETRAETTVIFSVDASGSAAMQRLAEAKGAVEQVLSDCYARRDHVALVAFRGTTATLLLPPTRSLARVRRRLADLAGGGTTPLAAGIDAALALAIDARKQDKTPLVVLMTDGRANVASAAGAASDRRAATADALVSGRALRAAGVRSILLDTSPRPRAEARLLAAEMGARYLPLPYADAAFVSQQVRALGASEAP